MMIYLKDNLQSLSFVPPFFRFQRSLPKDKSSPVSLAVAQKEESLNMTSAIWFAWGVLLNSGIGEGEEMCMFRACFLIDDRFWAECSVIYHLTCVQRFSSARLQSFVEAVSSNCEGLLGQ